MVRVACIGAGVWGVNLIRNFAKLGALQAICESHTESLTRCAAQYPQVHATDSYEEILANRNIDAVVIATPASRHGQMVKQALAAGKDVFVEKPLALTSVEGRDVVEMAERSAKIVMVGHLLQYHPAVKKLRELVAGGELGKVQYLYSNRLNIGRVRREENILWSFAPHDISTILMLADEMPATVQARGGTYLQKGIPDVTVTALAFSSGVNAHVFVSWLHPFKEQKLVVVGDRKMAVFDDLSKEKLVLYPHQVNWIDHTPVTKKADAEVVPIDNEEPLAIECRHFLDCVEKRMKPRTDGREALRVLEVLQAAQMSLDRDGAAIRLGDSPGTSLPGCSIHPTVVIDQPSEIQPGTKIWHFSHVCAGSRIGRDCSIGQNVVIGPNATIGNRVKIQNNVSVYEGVTLEDYVFCGPSMVFTNVINPRSAIPRKSEIKKTLVREGATLGANCTVLCGVTIGRHAFVGAGAVVTKNVPDHALVIGNPAEQTGWMCACGIKLHVAKGRGVCRTCGAQYRIDRAHGCRAAKGEKLRGGTQH